MKILQSIHRFDLITFHWCLQRRSLLILTHLSRWISKTADGHLYIISGLVLSYTGTPQVLTVLLVLFTFERLTYFILKNRFRRNRPPQVIPDYQSAIQPSDQFSFPSGHTSGAFLFAGIISAAFPGLAIWLYPWAVLVGCSRVILGVHFPSDTLAGATLGASFSVLAFSYNGLTAL